MTVMRVSGDDKQSIHIFYGPENGDVPEVYLFGSAGFRTEESLERLIQSLITAKVRVFHPEAQEHYQGVLNLYGEGNA